MEIQFSRIFYINFISLALALRFFFKVVTISVSFTTTILCTYFVSPAKCPAQYKKEYYWHRNLPFSKTIYTNFCNITFLKLLPSKIRPFLNELLFIPLGLKRILRHRGTKFRCAAGDMTNYTQFYAYGTFSIKCCVYAQNNEKLEYKSEV
jgi:hypothetical protein